MTPFDRWLTTQPEPDPEERVEVEYVCPKCGHTADEHPEVPTPDGNNVMQVCPNDRTHADDYNDGFTPYE